MPPTTFQTRHLKRALLPAVIVVVVAGCSPISPAYADVTPPDPPAKVFVNQGSEWRSDGTYDVWWHTPPGQEAPISVAHYELCSALPVAPCETHQTTGTDVSALTFTLPHAGLFWLRVWLEDAVGNVSVASKSLPVMVRFDDGIPPQGALAHDEGWLGEHTEPNPSFAIQIGPGDEWPLSGIRGYSITTDGTTPDGEVEAHADQDYDQFRATYAFSGLSEGTTTVKVRSVSAAGVVSGISTTRLRLDRTAPEVSVDGTPPDDGWQDREVSARFDARDQPGLSGMTPAPSEKPVESGAHVSFTLDAGPLERVRGDHAEVVVSSDGHHTISYRAFDAAGNGSVEKEAVFKIDRTSPEGAFRALDPKDPRAVRVDVADATSGVAGGRIEYRREGAARFEALETFGRDGLLSARLDDQSLAPGRYELRAVVTDVAGNEAVIDRWADGSASTIALPLRVETRMTVGGGQVKPRRCAKRARGRRGKAKRGNRGPRSNCRKAASRNPFALGYGKRASSSGRLTTAQGAAVTGATVLVEGQDRSGGRFAELGSIRTDAQGRFAFTIPAGPSRTIRYRYDGTNAIKPTASEIVTKVRAAARLTVDRRRLRNGQAVRFTGRLLGKPIPTGGKLVALQARVGSRWRTFATPRTNAKGVFRHRYRFTATTGLRRYAFRAVIAREAAYPYEAGVSRSVRVTVRGAAARGVPRPRRGR